MVREKIERDGQDVVKQAEEIAQIHEQKIENFQEKYSETYDYLNSMKGRTKECREAYDALQKGDIDSVRKIIDKIIERNEDALDGKSSEKAKRTIEEKLEKLGKISEELGNSESEQQGIDAAVAEVSATLRGASGKKAEASETSEAGL